MKKLLCLLLVSVCLFTGCEKVDTFKEGVYEGSAVDTYGGEENTATAKITVNAEDATFTLLNGESLSFRTDDEAVTLTKAAPVFTCKVK